MANKKFRRMITGILLSCNIASFPFCSAYDVLTETVANQSGSEQLKTLYRVGRKVQEHYAQNQSKVAKANETATTLYNQSIEELDDLKAYYDELFKDCCNSQKLKKLKEDFISSIKRDIVLAIRAGILEDTLTNNLLRYYAEKKLCTCEKYRFVPFLILLKDMPTCYSYIGLDTPPIDNVEDLFTLKAILPIQSLLMSLTTEKSLPEKLQKCTTIPAREYCTEYAKKVDNVLAKCSEQLETVREQKGKYIPANENHNMACQIYQTEITGEDPKLSDDEKKIQKTCARYLNEHVLTYRDTAHGTNRVSPSWESVYSAKLSVYKKKIDKLINDKKT